MHLYNLTLQKPGAINAAIYGNFSGPREHEVAVAKGHVLELMRFDDDRRVQTVLSTEVFGLIRSITTLRLVGQTTDYLVLGSDSGRIVVLEYKKESNEFVRVHMETYGKSGCRRITPGQFVARDPHGRALMVAAVEKQKLVYVMSRDASNALTISSPLEAHKAHALLFDVVGLDNGFGNPLFGALELDYGEADADPTGEVAATTPKLLVFYELDLGVNHVTRKWYRETDRGANMLIPVPGGADGPGGVLVACENWLLYEHPALPQPLRTPLPRRADMPAERTLLLGAWTMHKSKKGFFFLVQSELGDVYKVTLSTEAVTAGGGAGAAAAAAAAVAGIKVTDLVVKYFDTIPVATSLALSRNGCLFAAAEFGNHLTYQFEGLGDESDVTATAHAIKIDAAAAAADGGLELECPAFTPRPLTNLLKNDELPSLSPLTDARVMLPSAAAAAAAAAAASGAPLLASAGLTSPQLVTLCGRGARSSLRVLQQGLSVNVLASSPMPVAPVAVFTLPSPHTVATPGTPTPDKYIVFSFSNATVAMSVGESVEEAPSRDTGFVDSAATLAMTLLTDGSYCQVHPAGMRLIPYTEPGKPRAPAREWQHPGRRTILRAACNSRQVVLALSGGELIYFEFDPATRFLKEQGKKAIGAEVTAITLAPVPEGRLRYPFVALADTTNMTRVLSLEPDRVLEPISSQALRAPAESLAIVPLRINGTEPSPHLFIGLQNGVLTRLVMDGTTGMLSDPRVRFLGVRPVRLVPITVAGAPALLALSTRAFVAYNLHGRFHMQPVSYDTIDAAAPFVTEAAPECLATVCGPSMRVLALDNLAAPFNQKALPLRHTPRRMALHVATGTAIIVQSDHNAYTMTERLRLAAQARAEHSAEASSSAAAAAATGGAGGAGAMDADADGDEMDMDTGEGGSSSGGASGGAGGGAGGAAPDADGEVVEEGDPQQQGVDARRVGYPLPATTGKWGSCLHLVDLSSLTTSDADALSSPRHPAVHHVVELEGNEAAVSIATIAFHDKGDEQFVLVGTVKNMSLHPRRVPEAYIHTYRIVQADVAVDAENREVRPGAPTQAGSRKALRLYLLHKTPVEDIPFAIAPFFGRALIGVGNVLRMVDLGKKRLLRKCEARGFPTLIHTITSSMDRVFVGDAAESVHFVKYKRAENVLSVFADDTLPRSVTALCPLDHDTVAGGDKFGNIFVLRVPPDVSDNVDSASGDRALWESAAASATSASNKCAQVACVHVGEVVTGIHKAVLVPGGAEVLLYTTLQGTIGALMPFGSKDDLDFFTHLELYLRAEAVSLVGRDHTSYRSAYMPVSNVIDGDLCEAFLSLPPARQKAVAADLDRTPAEVLKKLEDVRNRVM